MKFTPPLTILALSLTMTSTAIAADNACEQFMGPLKNGDVVHDGGAVLQYLNGEWYHAPVCSPCGTNICSSAQWVINDSCVTDHPDFQAKRHGAGGNLLRPDPFCEDLSAAQAKDAYFETHGTDWESQSGTIVGTTPNASSKEDCEAECYEDRDCTSYSFENDTCRIATASDSVQPGTVGYVYEKPTCYTADTVINGFEGAACQTLNNPTSTSVKNASDCATECAADVDCVAFSHDSADSCALYNGSESAIEFIADKSAVVYINPNGSLGNLSERVNFEPKALSIAMTIIGAVLITAQRRLQSSTKC